MPLDPYLASRLDLLAGLDDWDTTDPEERARLDEWARDAAPWPVPEVPTSEQHLDVDGRAVRVRVYGTGDGSAPCLVWVHGGAFVAGDIDMNEADLVARELCVRAGAVVVSVDYWLGPRVTYPVPHRQVAGVLRWAHDHASDLGVDPARIVLGGGSAGGALSVAAARQLAADGAPLPCALVLAYPVAHFRWPKDDAVDALMADLPRLLRFLDEDIVSINDAYVLDHPDPRFAFLDLDPAGIEAAVAALPPALVLISEYDDLRPSAELLVQQARAAGRLVERRLCRGVPHGHLGRTPALAEVDASLDEIARVVRTGTVRDAG